MFTVILALRTVGLVSAYIKDLAFDADAGGIAFMLAVALGQVVDADGVALRRVELDGVLGLKALGLWLVLALGHGVCKNLASVLDLRRRFDMLTKLRISMDDVDGGCGWLFCACTLRRGRSRSLGLTGRGVLVEIRGFLFTSLGYPLLSSLTGATMLWKFHLSMDHLEQLHVCEKNPRILACRVTKVDDATSSLLHQSSLENDSARSLMSNTSTSGGMHACSLLEPCLPVPAFLGSSGIALLHDPPAGCRTQLYATQALGHSSIIFNKT